MFIFGRKDKTFQLVLLTNMQIRPLFFLILFLLTGLFIACRSTPDTPPLFTKIGADESGVTFNNQIQPFEGEKLNANTYDPMYNGAGVGVGDFNNDGWSDLFFAGNMVTCRLYLNRMNASGTQSTAFRFEDVTKQAGLQTRAWCTGVSVVDLNQDGWLDIYVSVAGPDTAGAERKNLLFLNQQCAKGGTPTFREVAQQVGLADSGMNTQAAFFDYDRDGDLDCYVLNNAFEQTGRNSIRPRRLDGSGKSTDRLYRNEGRKEEGEERDEGENSSALSSPSSFLPHFKDVSREAGITAEGYGLGLTIADLNQDGWLDIYCANDFLSNDVVWVNNRNGTFVNRAAEYFKHTSYNSMGVDIQDVNNDNRPDVMVVDMMPETNERQKMMLVKTNWDFFTLARQQGYQDEYVRNTLQLNMGMGGKGERGGEKGGGRANSLSSPSSLSSPFSFPSPSFSEIGQLAGVSRTDWSWAPLLADLDNDGWKDLTVSNGYRRDITNLDYVIYLNEQISRYGLAATHRQTLDALYKLPEIKLHNYVYRNKGGDQPDGELTFEDKSLAWGLGDLTFSNGAVYADLDNDGDLDLVFNNIDEPAGLYRNETNQKGKPFTRHFLRLKLPTDAHGSGAEVRLTLPDGSTQTTLAHPVRGYTSSVESVVHFGLGKYTTATAQVRWADGTWQPLGQLQADRTHTVRYQPTASSTPFASVVPTYFNTEPAAVIGIPFRHQEALSSDWQRTPMLPQVYAKNGPAIAIADVDGNGLDDVFVGADPGQVRTVYVQTKPGHFSALVQGANPLEDMGALFFDADADGDQDLYVVSGGTQQPDNNPVYQDRLYLNDGHGKFTRSQGMLPPTTSSGSCVVAVDFDHDGDLDLFRGGRVKVESYPMAPTSYLLRNDNGRFTDVTDQLAPGLRQVGMVCTALWTDYDNDGWADLLVAGEFMPITLFKNGKTKFQIQPTTLPSGQWNSLTGADFDCDGDIDYLAGNTGLNTRYRASPTEPVHVYGKDFDGNGKIDPILTYYLQGTEQVAAIRDVMNDQMTTLSRKRFTNFQMYAQKSFADMFTDEDRTGATRLDATELRSVYIENKGNGKAGLADFAVRPLPIPAQIAPVFGVQTGDFNGDGWRDALLVGNSYAPETYSGWYDAGRGTLLLGDGKGHFRAVSPDQAGLQVDGDAKGLAMLSTGSSFCYLVTNNNGLVQCLTLPGGKSRPLQRLNTTETNALIRHPNGRTERVEYYYGSGYLSQSSRVR